ncbi:MAG: aminotransferase class I/II-fold pyridoxal phosphate-dependent enzyme [Lachnospiraceae bacterium]|nr:aminotransferase class I/II-fold pyridoxal phosphate-dependent enzyme [Lachnospiraceae bacterium]
MKETLYEKLLSLKHTGEYPFHMPGHKRNETDSLFDEIVQLDITEIEGFDNLHHAEGILKKEQEFAAELYGAEETFFLINGSTAGVLAAICATTDENQAIVISRNAHKSAYHALFLKNLTGCYVYPQSGEGVYGICGNIRPEDVAEQMDESGAKVVFVTSPTYEGILSDIARIAEEVHKRDGILIVDEAHGAHLGFHSYFPESAVLQGADIVVQSMHKTLPSLTQTALLHVCSDRVCRKQIAMWLGIFQTSSPSYVLMASMSRCLHMLKQQGNELFEVYAGRLQSFYNNVRKLQHLKVIHSTFVEEKFGTTFDPSKINICVHSLIDEEGNGYQGKELARELLDNYGLQMEMVSGNYVIAMTSINDTQEGFDRLEKALFEIDGRLCGEEDKSKDVLTQQMTDSAAMTIKAALGAKKKKETWMDCVGKISAEYIYLYPPGSPILTPGERISESIWQKIEHCKELGLSVQGPEDGSLHTLWVVEESEHLL